jgi:threonine/homoserine/homoserine lactone efflux protein
MLEIIQVFFTGTIISFLGQLPFGNMNLIATQLGVQESFANAWKFAFGVVLIEVIYLRLALAGMDWVVMHEQIFIILGWITVVVFLALGILGFILAKKQTENKKGLLLSNNMHRFLLGISMSLINPAQLPFWFLWSTQMMSNGLLHSTTSDFNFFTVGAGLGSLAGLAVYIYGGKWAIEKMKASNRALNIFMGIIFIIAALLQLYHMLSKDSFISQATTFTDWLPDFC